jgi:hypothetical protein
VAAVVLLTAAALLLLRSTVDTSPSTVDRPAVAGTTASPRPVPPPPTPPFDGRLGRTPIPGPDRTGSSLSGPLPRTGGPDRQSAARAVDLVLGRFCLEPALYTYTLGPDGTNAVPDWRHVSVLVFSLERGGGAPSLRLSLDWTGTSYRWVGPTRLLVGC